MTDSTDKTEDGVKEENSVEDVTSAVEEAAADVVASAEDATAKVADEVEAAASGAEEEAVSVIAEAIEVTETEEKVAPEPKETPAAAQTSAYAMEHEEDTGMGLLPFMAAVVAMFVVAGASLYFVMSGSDTNVADTKSSQADLQTTAAIVDAPEPDVSIEELMKPGSLPENSLGDENAPVTIVEYSSMTCPHCAHFHEKTLPALKEKYIDTGKVRYIIREFPLDNLAAAAFMLARCAGKDRYFPLIDALYAQQESWAYGQGDPTPRLFKATKLAGASFTKESFEGCLRRQDLLDGINLVRERGGKFNIRSTPSFFINGRLLSGAQPLEKFEEYMKPYLKDAK